MSDKFIGHRSEQFRGESYRNLIEVTTHEINELCNTDIIDTIEVLYNRNYKEFLEEIYSDGYTNCVWLCRTKEDVLLGKYCDHESDIDTYIISDGIIISSFGFPDDGMLIAYKGKIEIKES